MATRWPPERYTVLRVTADGHHAKLLADEDDCEPVDDAAWRASYAPALAFARAYAREDDEGVTEFVAYVPLTDYPK